MKNTLVYCLSLVALILISCENENKSNDTIKEADGYANDEMEAKIRLALLNHFDYVASLELGWSREEAQKAIPGNYKLFVDNENYLSFRYQEDLFKAIVTFGFFEEEHNSNYTLSIEINKEKEALLRELSEEIEEKISIHWLRYLYTSASEENYVNWQIKRGAENIVVHLSTDENHLNVNAAYSDDDFLEEEKNNGEWVQVGEDGRWIFVPKN
jgi:hypothetical protein